MPAKKRVPESWGEQNAREQRERSERGDTQRDIAVGGRIVSNSDARQLEVEQAAKDAAARAAVQRAEVSIPAPADATAVRPDDDDAAAEQGGREMMDAVNRRIKRQRRP